MNQRKTIEFMLLLSKSSRKQKSKTFMQEVETFQPKATLHQSILLQLYLGQVLSATLHK